MPYNVPLDDSPNFSTIDTMRISIRWRFLLGVSGALLLCFVALHFTHRWQVRQQSGSFLRQADAARAGKDAAREAKDAAGEVTNARSELGYLQRYLIARPDAIDERERVARLMASLAKSSNQLREAFIVLEDVLRRDPSRDDLRRFVIDFALTKVGLVAEAKGHLEVLGVSKDKNPGDGVLEDQYAACLHFERNYESAALFYQKAYTDKPDLLNAYVGHSLLLREQFSNPDKADEVMASMVGEGPGKSKINATNFRAHLIRADYGRKYGQQKLAGESLLKAREFGPDEVDVILFTAEFAYADVQRLRRTGGTADVVKANLARIPGKLAEVRAELDRGRKLHPTSSAIYLSRAGLEAQERDLPAAIETLKAGLIAIPDDVEILLSLVDKQIGSLDRAGAEASLAQLHKLEYPANRVAYEEGRVQMLKEEWLKAARALDIVRVDAIDDAKLARSANLMLGRCYEQIGETDRRLEAFTRSIPEDTYDPLWVSGQLGQAEAYAALGRPEDALRTYQKLADAAPGLWLRVAKFRMLMMLRKPETDWEWNAVEIAIDRAVDAIPELKDDTEVQLLRADLHMFQKRDDECRKIVDELFAKRPKEPAVWVAKAARTYRDGNAQEAVAILERGRKEQEDPVELRMALALYATDPKEGAEAKLTKLAEGIEKYSPSVRRRLLRSLAEAATATGNSPLAGRYWDQVVAIQEDDLAAQLVRFDRYLLANDESGLERVQAEVRRVDGDGGVSTRVCRALYLIWKAQRTNDPAGLPEALTLLDEVERARPGWSRISLGKAVILDRQGKAEAALPFYQKAFEQGEFNPLILRRLIELYAAKGNFAQANEILSKLPDLDAGGPDAQRLAAEVSMRVDNTAQALKLAAKAVPADSKNPDDWRWLGLLRWQAGDKDGSVKAFQKAVDLNPKAPESWLLLVEHSVKNDKTLPRDFKEAKAKMELAKSSIPTDQHALFSARCHALFGEKKPAIELFQQARTEHPNDARVLAAEANYLMETASTDAEWGAASKAWERLIPLSTASDEDKESARRMFALCSAANPDYSRAKEAIKLLGMKPGGELINPVENETPPQRKTRALALAMQRDRLSKLTAIGILETDRASLAPADRFLLAKLYQQVGDRKNVRTTMSELVINSEKNPLHLAFLTYFATWLVEERDFTDAATWVAKLAKLQPDSLRTAELQAHVLAGKNDLPAAKALLQKQADKPDAPLGVIALIAEKTGLPAEAERWLRQYISANEGKRPEIALALAEFYGRANRLQDAMAICDKAWEKSPPLVVAQVTVAILSTSKEPPSKEMIARVTKKIEEACETKGLLKASVQPQLAYLRNLEMDYDASIAIFRTQAELPAKSPPEQLARALAMNNLAFLLAFHRQKHDEGLSLLKEAGELIGEYSDLQDTQALILMDRGTKKDLEDARPILENIIASSPSAVAYFHLALLEKKQGRQDESRLAWREAKRLLIKSSDLHPIERPAFDAMEKEFR